MAALNISKFFGTGFFFLLIAVTPSQAELVNIMSMGDSIGHGGSATPALTFTGFRKPLYDLFIADSFRPETDADPQFDFVGPYQGNNQGVIDNSYDNEHAHVSGARADTLPLAAGTGSIGMGNSETPYGMSLQTAAGQFQPDCGLVQIGINDTRFAESLTSTVNEIVSIINFVRAGSGNDTDFFLSLVSPVGDTFDPSGSSGGTYANATQLNDAIGDLNNLIAAAAVSNSTAMSPITIIDNWSDYMSSNGGTPNDYSDDTYDFAKIASHTVDDLHPNAMGDALSANKFYFGGVRACVADAQTAVPEPSAFLFLGLVSLVGGVALRVRKKKRGVSNSFRPSIG